MAGSIPLEQLELLIAGYVLGDLDSEEAAEFERLLIEHPTLVAEVSRMQTALELAYAPPELAPPAHLRTKILEANHQANHDINQPRPHPASPPKRSSIPWKRMSGAIAAVLIVALSINNYRLWRALQTIRIERSELETLVYALSGTEPETRTDRSLTASVVVDPNTLEATLRAENLPPLPPDQVYVLWTVLRQDAPFTVDDKAAILTEVFKVNDQGEITQTVPVPRVYRSIQFIDKLAITREDATSPQRHEGDPILISEF